MTFSLLRYVPDTVKNEFVNIGVVLFEEDAKGMGFAGVRFTQDWRRVRCLDPQADIEPLKGTEHELQARLQEGGGREALMRRLEDSLSNVVQLSPAKACLAEDPEKELMALASFYLETARPTEKRPASGRQRILECMREAFEQAQVLRLLQTKIPASTYTHPSDSLKFDFGYRMANEIKLFHAVSLKTSVEQAMMLAFRYPKVANAMERVTGAHSRLTAVVEDDVHGSREEVEVAVSAMKESAIQVSTLADMAALANLARRDLKV